MRKEIFKRISYGLKVAILLSALGGVVLSLFYAERDGYSHWSKRLLYFTGLSNVWIGICVLIILIAPFVKALNTDFGKDMLYVLRYIFTVSIAVTGIVYCFILAPFATEGEFNPWTLSNVLTHVVAPVLALADFFIDEYKLRLTKEHIVFTAIPPLMYFVFSSILNLLSVDCGRGEDYPYFFLNLKSPAGIFGFSDTPPFVIGSFYWILLFLFMVYSIAFPLALVNNKILKKASL
jgi:hypothetical protein